MPYFSFKHIWTPMILVGIRFYKSVDNGALFIKVGSRRRKQITNGKGRYFSLD